MARKTIETGKASNSGVGAKGKQRDTLSIGGINVKSARFTLVGTSDLIVHKFSEKAKGKIASKQSGDAKSAIGKERRDPQQEYRDSMYILKDGRYGFPISGFKKAAVSACRFIDRQLMNQAKAKGAFHIIDENGDGLAVISGKPEMRTDTVRLGGIGAPADLRYRASFPKGWKTTLLVNYNENAISLPQLAQLFNAAGFGVGIGDWRPEKSGSYGMFEVASNKE